MKILEQLDDFKLIWISYYLRKRGKEVDKTGDYLGTKVETRTFEFR